MYIRRFMFAIARSIIHEYPILQTHSHLEHGI